MQTTSNEHEVDLTTRLASELLRTYRGAGYNDQHVELSETGLSASIHYCAGGDAMRRRVKNVRLGTLVKRDPSAAEELADFLEGRDNWNRLTFDAYVVERVVTYFMDHVPPRAKPDTAEDQNYG